MEPRKHYFAKIPTIAIFIVMAMSGLLGVMLFILKGIDQDLLKGAIAGEHFQEQFFADCKDPELAAYVKTLL